MLVTGALEILVGIGWKSRAILRPQAKEHGSALTGTECRPLTNCRSLSQRARVRPWRRDILGERSPTKEAQA